MYFLAHKGMKEVAFKEINLAAKLPLTERFIYEPAGCTQVIVL